MTKLLSEYYFREPKIISSYEDRLDYYYWHPKFDDLITILSSNTYEVENLSKLVRSPIISGRTPENYVYLMKGVPFIGSRNVRKGFLNFTDIVYIDKSVHIKLLQQSKVNSGDVLVTMAGSIGRCAVYKEQKREANINQAVARVQPKHAKLDPQYLVYYLNSPLGQIQFDRNKHHVSQPNINTTEIGEIKIIYPPIKIQKKIVNELSIMENEIFIMTKKLQNSLEEITNIIPSELKLTIPSIKNDYYVRDFEKFGERLDFVWNQPSTDLIKRFFEKENGIPLSDLLEGEIEYGINAYGKKTGTTPFINIENLGRDGVIHTEGIHYLNNVSETKILKKNDCLISRSRTVGTCSLVRKNEEGYTFGSYILKFRVLPNKIEPDYLVNFINSELGQAQIRFLQTGSRDVKRGGGNNINPDQLKQLLIVLPKTPCHQSIIIEKINEKIREKKIFEMKLKEKNSLYSKSFDNRISK